MTEDDSILAIGRLERALSRSEQALARLNQEPAVAASADPSPAGDDADSAVLAMLRGENARLRAAIEQGIARIDGLTGSGIKEN